MPRGQEKFICIADLKGWGYSNSDIRAYIAALDIMQVCVSALQASLRQMLGVKYNQDV